MSSPGQKTIWSFDLGKASIGEAVRDTTSNAFLHVASLLIPAEFASTKAAASRRRMWRTRHAHKAREAWLDEVWRAAQIPNMPEPLCKRTPVRVDKDGNPVLKNKKGKWVLGQKADYRLEREFAPKLGESTRDGAPSDEAGAQICYTSCLLRIKLLRGESLESWQIYKALHSAIQRRGYGRVPWAAREAKRGEKSEEEVVAALLERDGSKLTDDEKAYRRAVEAWPQFKQDVPNEAFHFPCYYDAAKMGLWSFAQPEVLRARIDCTAHSTRKVRFDREDVEKEIAALARNAAAQLPSLTAAFDRWRKEGCTVEWQENPFRPKITFGKTVNSPQTKAFAVTATDFGAFLVHGPAGEPSTEARDDFAGYLAFRTAHGVHSGSTDDWLGATGQKTPRFDNRIINDCALISRLQVCNVSVRFEKATGKPTADSLLASEVTFLMKLKNTLVEAPGRQRKLTPDEVAKIFKVVFAEALAVKADEKNAEQKVASRFALTKNDWLKTKGIKEFGLHPLKGHEEVKPPKSEGRSRFSRPALRLVRALILSGQKPSEFLARLHTRDAALLDEIGMDVLDAEPVRFTGKNGTEKKFVKQPRPWVLVGDLKFLGDLARTNDTWDDLHFPEQRLDALEARHSDEDGNVDVPAAVRELLGSINDPIVRHRLEVFSRRLTEHHARFGVPAEVVLEFVRTDFMGEDAKRELAKFQSQREKDRKEAKEKAAALGFEGRSAALKYELFKAQSGECLYCQQPLASTELGGYDVEHIVPRKQGGPDAMVNYALAHVLCNERKGEQTPFQWKHGHEGWHAYETCVNRHFTALRNKKVQLLLREDAPDLVQRYTALAETAWISRLAQKIVSLHFGWRNGNDTSGPNPIKRVTVISGGLTARIRRRYRLNSLLAPIPPKYIADVLDRAWNKKGSTLTADEAAQANKEAAWEWESAAEKNREDDRHHALDAMVINFWNTGSKKQNDEFFRFPPAVHANPRGYFEKYIERVTPEKRAFEKAVLAETIYGGRVEKGETVIVQRVPLLSLGMKSVGVNKTAFDAGYLRKKLKSLRESQRAPLIEQRILDWLDDDRDETAWRDFCDTIRLPQRDGSPGPRVIRVIVYKGVAEGFLDMSKDQTGAYREGKREHKGQLVYWDEAGALRIRPIFAHGSPSKEREEIEALGGKAKFYEFFQAGCTVKTERELIAEKYSVITWNEAKQPRRVRPTEPLPAGTYLLGTIAAKNQDVALELANGTRIASPLRHLIEAGMKRAR